MTELRRQKLLVEQKAEYVLHDQAVLAASLERTVERFKKDVSSSKGLLTLFIAGAAYGLARDARPRSSPSDGDSERGASRLGLARIATLAVSALRLIDLARRADVV